MSVCNSPGQPLVTTGPYAALRHPSYTGLLLAFTGAGVLLLANWLACLLVAAVCLALVGYRIRVEEQALAADLGDRWRAYAAARHRLPPYIW